MTTRPALLQRGLYLEYTTLGWNVVGVGIVALAALSAHSIAQAGFGLDSLIEIFSPPISHIWTFSRPSRRNPSECEAGKSCPGDRQQVFSMADGLRWQLYG
jgi:hypothetical protein